ncbi:hypothetical protein JHK87_044680 [Glycine soja]|nr:hypothetical protein JHK87_044680 [Glycine soja]
MMTKGWSFVGASMEDERGEESYVPEVFNRVMQPSTTQFPSISEASSKDMPLKATETDVYEFFSKAGKACSCAMFQNVECKLGFTKFCGINAVGLSRGRKSLLKPIMAKEDHSASLIDDGNPKCQGHQFNKPNGINQSTALSDTSNETQPNLYIEFYDAMLVPMAIALSGQLLLGQPIMVKPSEAEKNLVQSNASGGAAGVTGPYGAVDRKLYVGNLHFNMTESQLREVFYFCCYPIGCCGEDAEFWHVSWSLLHLLGI